MERYEVLSLVFFVMLMVCIPLMFYFLNCSLFFRKEWERSKDHIATLERYQHIDTETIGKIQKLLDQRKRTLCYHESKNYKLAY